MKLLLGNFLVVLKSPIIIVTNSELSAGKVEKVTIKS